MSFAGFGAALGNLFGGVAGSLQEQEKLRMAREFQAKQMEDMGAQMEERKANAAYRLAEAERQKQLASPEVQRLIKLAMSGGEGSDDATAQLIAMDASRFGPLLKPKVPSPPNRQQVALRSPEGKSVSGSFETSTGKYYDAAGNEIANPVRYTPPRNDTLGIDIQKARLAHQATTHDVTVAQKNLTKAQENFAPLQFKGTNPAFDTTMRFGKPVGSDPAFDMTAMHAQTLLKMAQKKFDDALARQQDAQLRLMGMLGGQQSSLPPDIDPAEFAQFQSSRIPPTP